VSALSSQPANDVTVTAAYTKQTDTLRVHICRVVKVKGGGTHSYHCPLKCSVQSSDSVCVREVPSSNFGLENISLVFLVPPD
jgi:hypothetical protein